LSAARHHGGFTLIELVACIVIMAVLAAIAAPRFFNNQPFTERGYTDEVVAALRAAREVAVSSGCDVQVTLNPVAGYQALQRSLVGAACSGAWGVPVRLTNGDVLAGAPPSGAVLNPATTIVFGPQGQVMGAAPPPLVMGAGVYTLNVDGVSGFVR
jgi:prepilin-type N-terminal cleavage/methylation domain-containing protein